MIPTHSGRIPPPIVMTVVRDLTEADLFRLLSEPIAPTAPPTLQKITANHHAMARLIAAGRTATQVAILCNRTPQRVRDLQRDPAFKELVSYYQEQFADASIGDEMRLQQKARTLAELAVDEMTERLEDDEKRSKIPIGELRQIAGDTLDRTILPKKTAVPTSQPPANITFNIAGNNPNPRQIEPPTIEHEKLEHGNATPSSNTSKNSSEA